MAAPMVDGSHDPELVRAAGLLADGGCVVYPTETFYALGAVVGNASALQRIIAIKGRPQSKPLPVVIGGPGQLAALVSTRFQEWEGREAALRLMERFWPGPLSIVVPGAEALSPLLMDPTGGVSVRLTPHPQARALCLLAGSPLCATSANASGRPAVTALAGMDKTVLDGADMALAGCPRPVRRPGLHRGPAGGRRRSRGPPGRRPAHGPVAPGRISPGLRAGASLFGRRPCRGGWARTV